jgi:hypothetical protein
MHGAEGEVGRGSGLRRLLAAVAAFLHERRLARHIRRAGIVRGPLRVPRSAPGAARDARAAVRAGLPVEAFLRHRLAGYATRLPVPLEALPVIVDVEAGEAVVRARPRPGVLGPRLGPATPAIAPPDEARLQRTLREAEAAAGALGERAAAARSRADAAARELTGALASGAVVARPVIDATAEQLGRPPVDAAWPVHALRGAAGVLLAAEAWRFAEPVLLRAGVAPEGLEAALLSAPLPSALVILSATAAAAAAFAFAWVALSCGADAAAATPERGRGRLLLAWAAGTALLVPSIAAAATAPDPVSGLVLAATLPFAGAALWRGGGALAARRAAAAQAALEWDRARAREEVERGRRAEACARAEAEARAAEARRAEAEARVRSLHADVAAAARIAEEAARAAAERLDRVAEALAAALEEDRYLYLRAAGERTWVPRRRPALARVEPPVAPERLGAVS